MPNNKNIKVSVSALIHKDNKILLGLRCGKSYPGNFALPGGKLEHHEDPRDAVIRETKEETNLDIKVIGDLGYLNLVRESKHYLILLFDAVILDDSAEYNNNEPTKHEYFKWYELDKLPEPLLDGLEPVLKNFKNHNTKKTI